MRAVVLPRFGGPEVLEVRDVPAPVPGPGEVVVEVSAASINNTDVWTRAGSYGSKEPAGWLGPVDFPRIQGADACGYVAEAGPGVDPGLVGLRVLVDPVLQYSRGPTPLVEAVLGSEADGAHAERVVVRADRVHDVSRSPLTDEQLACLPISYGTAVGMLERAALRSGETLLVTGASGGVGLALVGLAAARGARVLALASSDRSGPVLASGADAVIDRRGDVTARLAELAPEGLDLVADVVGGSTVAQVMPRVRPGGRWVVAGAVSGPVIELDLRSLYLRSIALLGSTMHTPEQFEVLVATANEQSLNPVVGRVFSIEEAQEAHRAFEDRRVVGKLVLTTRAPSQAAE